MLLTDSWAIVNICAGDKKIVTMAEFASYPA